MSEPSTHIRSSGSLVLDEALLALRAARGDASGSDQTLARIHETLEHPSARERVVTFVRAPQRYYNPQAAAVVALGLLLATSSYAAFFGVPTSLVPWSSSQPPAATKSVAPRSDKRALQPRATSDLAPPPSRTEAAPPSAVTLSAMPEPADQSSRSSSDRRSEPASLRAPGRGTSQNTDRVSAGSTKVSLPNAPPAPVDSEQLYAKAHHLHFVIRDPSAALEAWERYLRVAGDAPLAVEARYNRALCLVRIGDRAAARDALMAIARGDQGAYRQKEARALLKVLP